MTDVREMSYAAIVIAVLDGHLTQEEADAEFKRRAGCGRSAALTHLAASAKDDDD